MGRFPPPPPVRHPPQGLAGRRQRPCVIRGDSGHLTTPRGDQGHSVRGWSIIESRPCVQHPHTISWRRVGALRVPLLPAACCCSLLPAAAPCCRLVLSAAAPVGVVLRAEPPHLQDGGRMAMNATGGGEETASSPVLVREVRGRAEDPPDLRPPRCVKVAYLCPRRGRRGGGASSGSGQQQQQQAQQQQRQKVECGPAAGAAAEKGQEEEDRGGGAAGQQAAGAEAGAGVAWKPGSMRDAPARITKQAPPG